MFTPLRQRVRGNQHTAVQWCIDQVNGILEPNIDPWLNRRTTTILKKKEKKRQGFELEARINRLAVTSVARPSRWEITAVPRRPPSFRKGKVSV